VCDRGVLVAVTTESGLCVGPGRDELVAALAAPVGGLTQEVCDCRMPLQADQLVPIHYDGYALPGVYEPVPDAIARLNSRSDRVALLELGQSLDI